MGSSHGGYLSHLVAKLTPWNVQAVIDNSSYARVNFGIMGLGKEIDYTRFSSMILIHYTRETNEYHIITSFHDKTL
ncbi:DUF2920 family protein [Campylobacter sp. LR286c]|nr:DUF2920 family protein [Campylobacter sp. LR286c]